MGELILMAVSALGTRVAGRVSLADTEVVLRAGEPDLTVVDDAGRGRGRARLVDTMIEPYPMGDRKRRFVLFPARTWLHVAERMSNGQLTARWSKAIAGRDEGAWFTSEGWKRPNRRGRLSAEQMATVEEVIKGAPTEREERDRVCVVIETMRQEDREFITPETVAEFAGVCTIEAREAIERVFGAEWLARQDAAVPGGAAKATARPLVTYIGAYGYWLAPVPTADERVRHGSTTAAALALRVGPFFATQEEAIAARDAAGN